MLLCMSSRRYYIRHEESCKVRRSYKLRTATFSDQVAAGNAAYDQWECDVCTGSKCRVRPTPIVMLVPDPYFEED